MKYFRGKTKIIAVAIVAIIQVACSATPPAYAQTLSLEQMAFVDEYHETAIRLGAEYNAPWQTSMAQALVESRHGTSGLAIKDHNFHGIGSTKVVHYGSDEEGWEGYYDLVTTDERYVTKGSLYYVDDPHGFLECITYAGYNPYHENYIHDIGLYVDAVEEYRLAKGWPTSSEYRENYERENEIPIEELMLGFRPRNEREAEWELSYIPDPRYNLAWTEKASSAPSFTPPTAGVANILD